MKYKSAGGAMVEAGRQIRPAGLSFARSFIWFKVVCIASGFGEDRETVGDQVNRVVGSTIGLVARLTDAPGDADEITDVGLGEFVAQFAEQGEAVPARIGFPAVPIKAVVVGGN